jgi:hypothetical protein
MASHRIQAARRRESSRALFEGADWQIYETMGGGRALVVLTAGAALAGCGAD